MREACSVVKTFFNETARGEEIQIHLARECARQASLTLPWRTYTFRKVPGFQTRFQTQFQNPLNPFTVITVGSIKIERGFCQFIYYQSV
jgi:hypothetical protein